MTKPERDDVMHANRYERAPDERSIYHRYEDALARIEQLESMAHPSVTDVPDADDVERRFAILENRVSMLEKL